MKAVTQAQVESLLADFLAKNKARAVRLLNLNGIAISNTAPVETVQIAFLKALKDSESFRSQASQMLYDYGSGKTNLSFVDHSEYLNLDDPEPWLGGTPATTSTTATTAPKKSGIGGFIGSIFTPDVIKDSIKTGLNTYSTSVQAKANASTEQNALELERIRLAQIQASNEAAKNKPGLSTGAKIGIGIGGAALLSVIIYLFVKAKKRKAA